MTHGPVVLYTLEQGNMAGEDLLLYLNESWRRFRKFFNFSPKKGVERRMMVEGEETFEILRAVARVG